MALRTPLSVTPHLYMGDSTGRPLDMGTVYFGEPDKDPEFYPIDLFSDDALTLPLAQPVHTKGGYLYDKGDMVEPHAKEIIYSVKVLDSYGRKVFYKGAMMRNSWNDDVIEQINEAVIGSADVARQVATDITNEAINNTAVEGGILADTFVVVDGSLSQRTINKGLESIADLSTINNPKDGLRVYVKSYHAGLGKGGGYFTYDSSKATENNTGTVINGWVRDIQDGVINITMFGAKGGGADDTEAFKTTVQHSASKSIVIPLGTTCISDTISLGRGVSVTGEGHALSGHNSYNKSRIEWIGSDSPRKTMIQLGANKVGAEPTIDATAITVKDINLEGAGKVGFLMYGTYLTNNTLIQNVYGQGSTEYNFYFACAWYLTINRLISGSCKHNGIALAMPLVYSDGEIVDWSTPAPLEINNATIFDIRSINAGYMYRGDAPNTWKPTKQYLIHGYGIGAGIGNGFRLSNFLSEGSGGVNLYSYNQSQPSKTIENGYLERPCVGSGLDPATDMVNMFLDYSDINRINGGGHIIKDVFMNYNSGGIVVDGASGGFGSAWSVRLENIHQPRFLKHINQLIGGLYTTEFWNPIHPLYWVVPVNCYYDLRLTNLPTKGALLIDEKDVNTRYDWSFDMPTTLQAKFLLIKSNEPSDKNPIGSIAIELANGSVRYVSFPSTEFSRGRWVVLNSIPASTVKIIKSGSTANFDSLIDIMVVEGSPAHRENT